MKSVGHAFSLENVVVLDREEQWHRRGVLITVSLNKKVLITVSLNKKGGGSDTHCRTRGTGQ